MSLEIIGPDSTSPLITPPSFQDDDDPVQSMCDFVDIFFNTFMNPIADPVQTDLPLIDLFEESRELIPAEVLSVRKVPATSQPTHLYTPTLKEEPAAQGFPNTPNSSSVLLSEAQRLSPHNRKKYSLVPLPTPLSCKILICF